MGSEKIGFPSADDRPRSNDTPEKSQIGFPAAADRSQLSDAHEKYQIGFRGELKAAEIDQESSPNIPKAPSDNSEPNWVDDIKYGDKSEPNWVNDIHYFDESKDSDPLPTKAEKVAYVKDQVTWFHSADSRSEAKQAYKAGRGSKEDFESAQKDYESETDKLSEQEWKLPDGYDLKELKTKNEIYGKLIELADSFEGFYDALKTIDQIPGGHRVYTAQELITTMDELRAYGSAALEAKVVIDTVTNTYGIRDKLIVLLSKEPKKAISSMEAEKAIPLDSGDTQPIDIAGEIPIPHDTLPQSPVSEGGVFQRMGAKIDSATEKAQAWGVEFRDSVNAKYEQLKQKANPVMGFIKERAKGLVTVGWWEFHQAEKLRAGTKQVGQEAQVKSKLVQETHNLSLDASHDEANQIDVNLDRAGIVLGKREYVEQLSQQITSEKQIANRHVIDQITASSMVKIREKLTGALANYRSAHKGTDVINDEEIMKRLENDIRNRLVGMADGQGRKDLVSFTQILRNDLDANWWKRYVYGAGEAALWMAGIYYANVGKLFLGSGAKETVAAKGISGAGSAAEAAKEVGLEVNKNIWTTLKKKALENGLKNVSDSQLMDWSKQVLEANKMFEPEWLSANSDIWASSRQIPTGFMLKIPAAVAQAIGGL